MKLFREKSGEQKEEEAKNKQDEDDSMIRVPALLGSLDTLSSISCNLRSLQGQAVAPANTLQQIMRLHSYHCDSCHVAQFTFLSDSKCLTLSLTGTRAQANQANTTTELDKNNNNTKCSRLSLSRRRRGRRHFACHRVHDDKETTDRNLRQAKTTSPLPFVISVFQLTSHSSSHMHSEFTFTPSFSFSLSLLHVFQFLLFFDCRDFHGNF